MDVCCPENMEQLNLDIMSCIKEVRFLFSKYKVVRHNFKMVGINKFMSCSISFHVHYECEDCGLTKEESFVQADTLILRGISAKVLNDIGTNYHSLKP